MEFLLEIPGIPGIKLPFRSVERDLMMACLPVFPGGFPSPDELPGMLVPFSLESRRVKTAGRVAAPGEGGPGVRLWGPAASFSSVSLPALGQPGHRPVAQGARTVGILLGPPEMLQKII